MRKQEVAEKYNQIYQREGRGVLSDEAIPNVRKVPEYLPGGTALDIGGGAGRNALFLARNGFTVDVVDLSAVGIARIQKAAKADNLPVTAAVADITETGIAKDYDVMVISNMLNHLTDAEARTLLTEAKDRTNPSGLNVVRAFLTGGDFYHHDPEADRFFVQSQELLELYEDWEILNYLELPATAHVKNPNGTYMTNITARLLARKRA